MKATLGNRIDPFVNGPPSRNGKPTANRKTSTNGKPSAPDSMPEANSQTGPPAPEPAPSDRGGAGRFQPGCKPGPGNPFARRVAMLRKALLDSVAEPDVARLGRKLLEQALEGDVVAAKVLLAYVIGKPADVVDPDRVEIEAWKLILAWPTLAEAVAGMTAVPPGTVVETIQKSAPATPDDLMQRLANTETLQGGIRVMRRREEKGK